MGVLSDEELFDALKSGFIRADCYVVVMETLPLYDMYVLCVTRMYIHIFIYLFYCVMDTHTHSVSGVN